MLNSSVLCPLVLLEQMSDVLYVMYILLMDPAGKGLVRGTGIQAVVEISFIHLAGSRYCHLV